MAADIQYAYAYYMHRLETEPGYRDKLASEIKTRGEKYRGMPPRKAKKAARLAVEGLVGTGTYWIRGANRRKRTG